MAEWMVRYLAHGDRHTARMIRTLYRMSGIGHRYSVLPDFQENPALPVLFDLAHPDTPAAPTDARMGCYAREAVPLAASAALDCLAQSATDAGHITHLVTVSCTGLMAPGLELLLPPLLGLPADIERFSVNFSGCYAALQALRLARALAVADPHAQVLVVCVELCTLHFQQATDTDNLLSGALFGDGAAAALVLGDEAANGQGREMAHTAQTVLPQGAKDMAWRVGSHGFEMTLSTYVPDILGDTVAVPLQAAMQAVGAAGPEACAWAIHPGGRRILQACEAALGIGSGALSASYHVLQRCGNMSSPTVLFVLREAMAARLDAPVIAAAFGPGLTVETLGLLAPGGEHG